MADILASRNRSSFEWWDDDQVLSVADFLRIIDYRFSKWRKKSRSLAWRGVVDASWPLHSSLYRRMIWSDPSKHSEKHLKKAERKILTSAHQWGLHFREGSRQSVLYQLALLQHYGAPTRLIDITFNPLVALFFSVQELLNEHGDALHEDLDGRIFVFDITNRILNESRRDLREWDDAMRRPWAGSGDEYSASWGSRYYAWRPTPVDHRIAAQNSGFLLGGVPDDASYSSIAIKRISPSPHKGSQKPTKGAVFTMRVPACKKVAIRRELANWFDIEARTVFPDYPGLASFGVDHLRRASDRRRKRR